jgi:hypothetical protein
MKNNMVIYIKLEIRFYKKRVEALRASTKLMEWKLQESKA